MYAAKNNRLDLIKLIGELLAQIYRKGLVSKDDIYDHVNSNCKCCGNTAYIWSCCSVGNQKEKHRIVPYEWQYVPEVNFSIRNLEDKNGSSFWCQKNDKDVESKRILCEWERRGKLNSLMIQYKNNIE